MMNQEDIFKKIGLILDELQDQYAYLAKNPKQLNELELELFMANANFLSDHVQIVQKLNNNKVPKQLPEHTGDGMAHDVHYVEAIFQAEAVFDPEVPPQEVAPAIPKIHSDLKEVPQSEAVPQRESAPLHFSVPEETTPEHLTEVSAMDQEVFKLDKEPSTFEFILKDIGASDRFEFEEKSVDDIFDRPLSKEEEQIIAQKQKLREQESPQAKEAEETDEIGPEPFLVAHEADVVPPATTDFVVDDMAKKEVQGAQELPFESSHKATEHQSYQTPEPKAYVAPEPSAKATEPAPYKASEPAPYQAPETTFKTPEKKEEVAAKPTLNELLASQRGIHNLNSDSNRNAITDLKQGINLNDKMLYIKDLFNGYNLAYAEVIDLINKMPDFKTADAFLQNNYAVKNNWAARQATVDKFYELLSQRFPAK